jgi:hypothetical protein
MEKSKILLQVMFDMNINGRNSGYEFALMYSRFLFERKEFNLAERLSSYNHGGCWDMNDFKCDAVNTQEKNGKSR